jgi:hypothetical protein
MLPRSVLHRLAPPLDQGRCRLAWDLVPVLDHPLVDREHYLLRLRWHRAASEPAATFNTTTSNSFNTSSFNSLNTSGSSFNGASGTARLLVGSAPSLNEALDDRGGPTALPNDHGLQRLASDLIRLRRSLEQSEAERMELQAQLAVWEARAREWDTHRNALQASRTAEAGLREELAAAKTLHAEEIAALVAALEQSQAEGGRAAAERHALHHGLAQWQQAHAQLQRHSSDTAARLADADERLPRLETEARSLRQALVQAQEGEAAAQGTLHDLQARLDREATAHRACAQSLTTTTVRLKTAEVRLAELEERADPSAPALQATLAMLTQAQGEKERCISQCAALQRQANEASSARDRAVVREGELAARLAVLEQQLQDALHELGTTRASLRVKESAEAADLQSLQEKLREAAAAAAGEQERCHHFAHALGGLVRDLFQLAAGEEAARLPALVGSAWDPSALLQELRDAKQALQHALLGKAEEAQALRFRNQQLEVGELAPPCTRARHRRGDARLFAVAGPVGRSASGTGADAKGAAQAGGGLAGFSRQGARDLRHPHGEPFARQRGARGASAPVGKHGGGHRGHPLHPVVAQLQYGRGFGCRAPTAGWRWPCGKPSTLHRQANWPSCRC